MPVIKNKGSLVWSRQRDGEDNPNLLDGIRERNEHELIRASGYSDIWLEKWKYLAGLGIIYAARAKAASLQNHTHDPNAIEKDIDYAQKTAPANEAERGHLAVRQVLISCTEVEGADETFSVSYQAVDADGKLKIEPNGKPTVINTFATYERQTISSILLQIYDGRYSIVEVSDSNEKPCPYLIIQDTANPPRPFKIFFNPTDFKPGVNNVDSYSSVKAKAVKYDRLRERNLAKNTMYVAQEQEQNLLKLEDIIYSLKQEDLGKTVRLMRFENDNINSPINDKPHIVSNNKGIPVKGDVDTEFMWTPLTLPPQSLRLANIFHKREGLIKQLSELRTQLSDAKQKGFKPYEEILSNVITKLETMDPDQANRRIQLLGNITVFQAAIVLNVNNSVRHGEEAFSPVKKENIVLTHIPNPTKKGKFIVTHNEYELVQTELNLPHDQYRLFNPTIFVSGIWRKDLKPEETKGLEIGSGNHTCMNKTDEQASIELHKLHYKQHLLEIKHKFMTGDLGDKDKFNTYLQVMDANYKEMGSNTHRMKDHSEEFLDSWKQGRKIMEAIESEVKQCNLPENIMNELAIIKEKATKITQPTARTRSQSLHGQKLPTDHKGPHL